nr:uncharacterized protein LOC108175048 [Malus domestica]
MAGMAIKLDMAKAYDHVEWEFLLAMMAKLGFAPQFCRWIKECISSASFNVIVNETPQRYIHPQRGLRQGDLISLYLFLIYIEGFSALIQNGMERGALHGFKMTYTGASVEELKGVVEVLKTYAAGSGQEINLSKSSISFGSKTPKKIRKTIERIFNIQSKDGFGRYLGLQADFRHSKKAVFEEVREKIESRMVG